MKKVTITAAIAAALLFTVATGLATVPTDSPRHYVFGHHGKRSAALVTSASAKGAPATAAAFAANRSG